jgi:hypothetical protein
MRVVSKADVLDSGAAMINSFILNRSVNRYLAPTKNYVAHFKRFRDLQRDWTKNESPSSLSIGSVSLHGL